MNKLPPLTDESDPAILRIPCLRDAPPARLRLTIDGHAVLNLAPAWFGGSGAELVIRREGAGLTVRILPTAAGHDFSDDAFVNEWSSSTVDGDRAG